ncbi:MAG: hypothetical protein Q9M50_11660 [Methylococcales bacterium]|nr:hypothetical protein [Methylococcales bacterium]
MGLFDRFKQKEPVARKLDHPRDLLLGDMVEFALMSQADLSHCSFQVDKIWTLDLGGDKHKRIYCQLNDVGRKIRLRTVDNDTVELGLEVYPETLLEVFSEEAISDILNPESGVNHQLKLNVALDKVPKELTGWLAENYRQEGFEIAYLYDDDYRHKSLPETEDEGEEGCDFAWLISDDRQYSVEFRVFDGGRTKVHLCAQIPLRKIDTLWPAKHD